MQRGSVFYWHNYPCPGGNVKDKYVVLLSDIQKHARPVLVMATSQQRRRSQVYGCQQDPAAFFIPEKATSFLFDTWLVLDTVPHLGFWENIQTRLSSGEITIPFVLNEQMVNAIKNCLLKNCELITEQHEKCLK